MFLISTVHPVKHYIAFNHNNQVQKIWNKQIITEKKKKKTVMALNEAAKNEVQIKHGSWE